MLQLPRSAMLKSELIQRLHAAKPHLNQRECEAIVDAVFAEVTTALARGSRVELRGFGSFSVRRRDGGMRRNPKTGEKAAVPERNFPLFRAGKELRQRLNSPPTK